MRRTLLALALAVPVAALAPAATAEPICRPPLHLDDPGWCFDPGIARPKICLPPLHLDDPGFCI